MFILREILTIIICCRIPPQNFTVFTITLSLQFDNKGRLSGSKFKKFLTVTNYSINSMSPLILTFDVKQYLTGS